jgi:tetratricopeptide (TPR) repeat protein
MQSYKKALYFNKILHNFALKADSPRLLSKSYCNFGTISYDQKKYDEALIHFCDMELYAVKINDNTNLAICFDMKARIYSEIGNQNNALDNFNIAIKYIECTQNNYYLAELLLEKAKVLNKMNDKIQANDVLKKALSKAVLSKRDDLIADIHNLLK